MTSQEIKNLSPEERDTYRALYQESSDYHHFRCMVRDEKLTPKEAQKAFKSAFRDYLLEY